MKRIEMIEKQKDYNLKIDSKIIQSLLQKLPFTGKTMHNERKDEFEKLLQGFCELKEKRLTIKTIDKMFSIVAGRELQISAEMYEFIIEKSKNATYVEAYEIFVKIIEMQAFEEKSVEMAKLLFNKALIDNELCPLILFPAATNRMIADIRNGTSKELIDMFLFKLWEYVDRNYNTKYRVLSLEEIKQKMNESQDMLRSLYGIVKLGIYGSYAKRTETELSDLDIWVLLHDKTDRNSKVLIKNFFENLFNIRVDLHIANDKTINEKFKEAITIFGD